MGNMSYCRFQNTLSDLHDCHDALCDGVTPGDIDSNDEAKACERLIRLCKEIADDFGDLVDAP